MNDLIASSLLTDLYQLTMMQTYWETQMEETAVFELFVRRLPKQRNFLVAAGLEQAIQFLETLAFTPQELDWIAQSGLFAASFVERLSEFRFTGSVSALPEGSIFFPEEPVLRVTAPLPQAQLVESRLMNLVHYQTLVASKAARIALVAGDRNLVDFGMRRSHGGEAALLAARASYIAGFSGTATVAAGMHFGIPVVGTMAHAFIQAHESESQAFERFALSHPQNVTFLIDTYNTEVGAANVVALAPRLQAQGIEIQAVRLDSGDLKFHSSEVRKILDAGGLHNVKILCTNGLDEGTVQALVTANAPIDGFGVGTQLATSADVPTLDFVYKLQEYAGKPRRKKAEGKSTWPGRKQVFRTFDAQGFMQGDIVGLDGEHLKGEPLLQPVMENGQRLAAPEALVSLRSRSLQNLALLPEELRSLEPALTYPVKIAESLVELAAQVDRDLQN